MGVEAYYPQYNFNCNIFSNVLNRYNDLYNEIYRVATLLVPYTSDISFSQIYF